MLSRCCVFGLHGKIAAMVRRRRLVSVALIFLSVAIYGVHSELARIDQLEKAGRQGQVASVSDDKLASFMLGKLAVKGHAPKTNYSRDEFGGGWAQVKGCDLRNLILMRDLKDISLGEDGCAVLKGELYDPYTGKKISFVRGRGTSNKVQIDHVVALSDAWQKGAQNLNPSRRDKLANDPLNLLAVSGSANLEKSDSDAGSWLPDGEQYRCRYVARQIAVKLKYYLWVSKGEKSAMQRLLQKCPAQQLPKVES